MALTTSQEAVLQRLNDKILADHEAAKNTATAKGQRHPPAPELLKPAQVEFPKWYYKDWKATDKALNHFVPGDSKLAHNEEEEKALLAKGYHSTKQIYDESQKTKEKK